MIAVNGFVSTAAVADNIYTSLNDRLLTFLNFIKGISSSYLSICLYYVNRL